VRANVELPRREEFRIGETVRVAHGPFSGQLGLYQGQRPRERVLVLLSLLGGESRVELPGNAIEVIRS
jgi:transcription antitermination factor NusG